MTSINPQPIQDALETAGFSHYGFATLGRPLSINFYRQWLDDGMHGSMEYLARHLPQKENPDLLLAKAQTAIVVAAPYAANIDKAPFKGLRTALYAQNEDYHLWLKEKLEAVISKLKELMPNDLFLAATDSMPILERDLAYRAGLGWVGKNTCLIDQQRGSFFLIGEILTTAALLPTATVTHPDRCGTCTRCIDACPTQALITPKSLDARRCISYLTIESKENAPLELRAKIGDHFFGCDICQTVCPWNRKAFSDEKPKHETLVADLQFILKSSKSEIERAVHGSALSRSRGRGLKRNAIVVIANLKLVEFQPELERYAAAGDQDPQLAEIAEWAISQLRT
jgi:epoxyqueuosine reductase